MIYLKSYNESIRHLLKPKSKDDILELSNKLSPKEKLKKGCKYGVLLLVKQALEDGVDPSIDNNNAILNASQYGYIDIVKELLKDERVDPSVLNNLTIQLASEFGRIEVVKELLKDDRVDPSGNFNYAIQLASLNGHVEIVKELLKDKRVNPASNNNYAIRYSSQNGHIDVVKELLKDKRVNPASNNNYAIKWASIGGHINVVKELLKDERVLDKLSKNDLDKYKIKLTESIKHLLKPKSEEQINKSIEKFHEKPELDKVNYFLEYDLVNILSKDKCKELINSINPEGRLEVIFELELDDDLFTIEEIKDIVKMGNYLDQISWIYTFDLDHLFDKEYIKNLIYKNTNDTDQVLDTILMRFRDELQSQFYDDDIKKIISKEDNNEQLRLINKYELEDIYNQEELRDIILDMEDGYDKLDWMLWFDGYFNEELGGLFNESEMIKIYNKLSNKDKEKIEADHKITF